MGGRHTVENKIKKQIRSYYASDHDYQLQRIRNPHTETECERERERERKEGQRENVWIGHGVAFCISQNACKCNKLHRIPFFGNSSTHTNTHLRLSCVQTHFWHCVLHIKRKQ